MITAAAPYRDRAKGELRPKVISLKISSLCNTDVPMTCLISHPQSMTKFSGNLMAGNQVK